MSRRRLGRRTLFIIGILGLITLVIYQYLWLNPSNRCAVNPTVPSIHGIISAQEARFLEKGEFANNIADLNLGIKTQTDNFNYSTETNELSVIIYAVSRKEQLTSYVGGTFLVAVAGGEPEMIRIVCHTKKTGLAKPNPPQLLGNEISCGQRTELTKFRSSVRCGLFRTQTPAEYKSFKISDDATSAYQAVNQANNHQVQQALQTSMGMESPDLKSYVLAAIAEKRAREGAWEAAFKITRSIALPKVRTNVEKKLSDLARSAGVKPQGKVPKQAGEDK